MTVMSSVFANPLIRNETERGKLFSVEHEKLSIRILAVLIRERIGVLGIVHNTEAYFSFYTGAFESSFEILSTLKQ